MASVRIEKLCKTFDEKTNVVDDVSVCIPDNEFDKLGLLFGHTFIFRM